MSDETTDPRFWSQGLLESAVPVQVGEVSAIDTLNLHAMAVMFVVSLLEGYREQAEKSGSHAAAKTIDKCMATLATDAMQWFDEAGKLKVTP